MPWLCCANLIKAAWSSVHWAFQTFPLHSSNVHLLLLQRLQRAFAPRLALCGDHFEDTTMQTPTPGKHHNAICTDGSWRQCTVGAAKPFHLSSGSSRLFALLALLVAGCLQQQGAGRTMTLQQAAPLHCCCRLACQPPVAHHLLTPFDWTEVPNFAFLSKGLFTG